MLGNIRNNNKLGKMIGQILIPHPPRHVQNNNLRIN